MNDDHEDLLISRAVDRKATEVEWSDLEARAAASPEVWERLAGTLRAECQISTGVAAAIACADAGVRQASAQPPRQRSSWRRLAVAAGILALVGSGWGLREAIGGPSSQRANSVPDAVDYDTALARCVDVGLRNGRVLEELPALPLDQRRTEGGDAIEVLYVRRLVERRIVPNLYRMAQDERGVPVLATVSPAAARVSTSF